MEWLKDVGLGLMIMLGIALVLHIVFLAFAYPVFGVVVAAIGMVGLAYMVGNSVRRH